MIFFIGILYFFLFLTLYPVTNHLLHKLRRLPPSPFPSLPLLGHLHILKKPLHRSLSSLSSSLGPVILLQFGSRRVLIVSSPSAAEECLSKNDVAFANRPKLLAGKHLGYNYTSLAWSSYGDHWRNLRRLASLELLSASRLQLLSYIRADEVRSLVKRLAAGTDCGCTVDMKSVFFDMMLNVAMRMIAGKSYCGEGTDSEEAREFQHIVTESFRIGGATNVGEFLPFLKWFGVKGVEESLIKLQEKRDRFMQRLIVEQKRVAIDTNKNKKTTKTLIEVMLSLQENDPEYYKDQTIKSIMLVLLAAGTDTSGNTLEWTSSFLLNHPEALQKARLEIDQVVGHGRLVTESDLPNLPYLHCIIYESLRMKPAGPLLVPHESSEECQVGGYRVPRGTMLLINLYAIQNNSKYWPDAAQFIPERFEGQEGPRDGYRMMPFGSGRRGCPGENLALRMVGLTLGTLIQCFEWEHASDGPVDMTEGTGLTMPKALPLLAKFRTRAAVVDLVEGIFAGVWD